jgi:hypothetical protein
MTATRTGWCLGYRRAAPHWAELVDNDLKLDLCAACVLRMLREEGGRDG